jgi:hypothetical protein
VGGIGLHREFVATKRATSTELWTGAMVHEQCTTHFRQLATGMRVFEVGGLYNHPPLMRLANALSHNVMRFPT